MVGSPVYRTCLVVSPCRRGLLRRVATGKYVHTPPFAIKFTDVCRPESTSMCLQYPELTLGGQLALGEDALSAGTRCPRYCLFFFQGLIRKKLVSFVVLASYCVLFFHIVLSICLFSYCVVEVNALLVFTPHRSRPNHAYCQRRMMHLTHLFPLAGLHQSCKKDDRERHGNFPGSLAGIPCGVKPGLTGAGGIQ